MTNEQKRIKVTVLDREDGKVQEFETDCMLLMLAEKVKDADGEEGVAVSNVRNLKGLYETAAVCMKIPEIEKSIMEDLYRKSMKKENTPCVCDDCKHEGIGTPDGDCVYAGLCCYGIFEESKNTGEASAPQEGRKLYVNENGRYAIDEWTEFHCGDGIDIFVDGEWLETSIEAVDGRYYAVGMEGKEIVGLYAKPNRGVRA